MKPFRADAAPLMWSAILEKHLSEYRCVLNNEEERLLALADLTDAAGRARIDCALRSLRSKRAALDEAGREHAARDSESPSAPKYVANS